MEGSGHISGTRLNTHWVEQLQQSRREEPAQVAAALEAQGGGVLRGVAIIEGSLAAADLPGSTFESVGFSGRRSQRRAHGCSAWKSTTDAGGLMHCHSSESSAPVRPNVTQPFSSVIQNVSHVEQPAEIDEREAAEFVALQHAGFIERNLGRRSSDDHVDCEAKESDEDRVILGKVNRMPKSLRTELSDGASLRSCREALDAAGHPWKLLSGTLVFVHPWQYRAVISALSCGELRPHHVIFSESLAYLLEETLARYKGSWLTACAPVKESLSSASQVGMSSELESVHEAQGDTFVSTNTGQADTEHEDHLLMCVQRTFVCLVYRCAALEKHVTASATDAHCLGSTNPRVLALEREDLWPC
jgi:hypothetical protein